MFTSARGEPLPDDSHDPDPSDGADRLGSPDHSGAPGSPGSPGSAILLDADDRADLADLEALEDAASTARRAEADQLRALGRVMHRTFGHATLDATLEATLPRPPGDAQGPADPPTNPADAKAKRAREDSPGISSATGRRRNAELEHRSLRLEVAARLHLSEYGAEKLMHTAHHAHDAYPATLDELASGRVGLQSVLVAIDEGLIFQSLPPADASERRAAYERELIPHARTEAPNRLRPIAHRIALELADLPLNEQHDAAAKRRCVQVRDLPDGMAEFAAYLPATAAYAIRDRVAQIAKHADAGTVPPQGSPTAPDSTRTRSQIEADVFADLLLTGEIPLGSEGSTPLGRGISAHVHVIVPGHQLPEPLFTNEPSPGTTHTTTARATATPAPTPTQTSPGQDSRPAPAATRVGGVAELVGYGPISGAAATEAAERAAADGDAWDIVKVTMGGTVISVKRYRPTPTMRRFITARDLHCRAPGCRRAAARCDIDHTVAAAHGGPTSTDNLAVLCRGHHVLKHNTGWRLAQHDAGVLVWTSPTGAEHASRPPSSVRFRARTANEPSK